MSSLSVANVLFVTIAAAVAPIAVLDSGPIFGVQTSLPGALAPVNKFLGVPFADPPVRFTLAKPPKKWVTPRNATDFRDSCPTAAVNNRKLAFSSSHHYYYTWQYRNVTN